MSALAAQGKDFDRTELNAMLDKLAASPEPKAKTGPMAMCYSMAVSERGLGGTDPSEYVAVNMSLRVKSWCDILRAE